MAGNRIDLHVHTTASDGSMSPREVVRYACEKDLKAIAITDHDDVSGIADAVDEGKILGVEVIPGVELSVDHEGVFFHLLGYMIDWENSDLNNALYELRESRNIRNRKIINKLNELGCSITYEEVLEESVSGAVGRPHFAQVMLKSGFVNDYYEAFNKYLRNGGPAYFGRDKISFPKASELIRNAGGLPVLAHPHSLGIKERSKLSQFIDDLAKYGLKGIEAHYSKHSKSQTSLYTFLAQERELIITGGTDFHGENKPGVDLGAGKGKMHIPYSILENLKKQLSKQKS